jgi:hypothetical protein
MKKILGIIFLFFAAIFTGALITVGGIKAILPMLGLIALILIIATTGILLITSDE